MEYNYYLEQLALLRSYAKSLKVEAILLNTNDEYISEYASDECNLLFRFTGFTGSNGCAIITENECYFFTDGRYMLQAQDEILPFFEIIDIKDFFEVLRDKKFQSIAINYKLFTADFAVKIKKENQQINLVNGEYYLRSKFKNRGGYYPISDELVGQSSKSKIESVQKYIKEMDIGGMLITNPQNVCWLLNIRGKDEDFTPVYKTTLFITKNSYVIEPDLELVKGNIFVEYSINYFKFHELRWAKTHYSNFVTELKAQKNQSEIEGVINAHKIDGKILTKFLSDLEQNYHGLNEFQVGTNLLETRKSSLYFHTPSFATICGCNENGAIVHYNAKEDSSKAITENSIILLDSGGQYADFSGQKKILGTTDVTRTIFVGDIPPEKYKKYFTLVLKGHIAVATAKLTNETLSREIDILARKPLQDVGLDYSHGTGHGVGAFLSVHEFGAGIGAQSNLKFKSGMVISNEPGCYFAGEFGIRIESLLLVREKPDGTMFFETITLVPIQEKSINFDMLTDFEKKWVEDYNRKSLENAT